MSEDLVQATSEDDLPPNGQLHAVYSPETGRVACVILQAAYGASQRVARMFHVDDWDTAPRNTMKRMVATPWQWEQIASMTREERVARWKEKTSPQRQGDRPVSPHDEEAA